MNGSSEKLGDETFWGGRGGRGTKDPGGIRRAACWGTRKQKSQMEEKSVHGGEGETAADRLTSGNDHTGIFVGGARNLRERRALRGAGRTHRPAKSRQLDEKA